MDSRKIIRRVNIMNDKRIALGCDHGGYDLKISIKGHLIGKGFDVIDLGTDSKDSVDYPDFAKKVAMHISEGKADIGIIVDGAGIGSSMVANKIKGVRAALCYDISSAKNARVHNNANVLTLGAGLIGPPLANQVVDTFLEHECTAERHLRRVGMIDSLDNIAAKEHTHYSKEKEKASMNISTEDLTKIAGKVKELMHIPPQADHDHHHENGNSEMVCRCGIHIDRKPETLRQFMDFGVSRIGVHNGTNCESVPSDIAKCIDHTILKPDATEEDIKRICAEAKEYHFASVCISPSYVNLAAEELKGTDVNVCTVVGFPSGAHRSEIKAMETRQAIRDGATEIDMVINVGALKSGNDDLVYRDIRGVREACVDGSAICKVIIEAAYLTDDEKVRAIQLTKKARAHYVKTSTGFGPHGATVEDVSLMNQIAGQAGMGIKAAGGIKSLDDMKEMVAAGATRIGASAGIKIIREAKSVTMSN